MPSPLIAPKWHDGVVRVVVCDEFALFRRRLVVALETAPDVEVAAEAADTTEALDRVREVAPDVVFAGASLPTSGAVRLAAAACEELPGVRFAIVLTPDDEPELLRAVRAGVVGFTGREQATDHAVPIARTLVRGWPVLTPAVAGVVLAEYRRLGREAGSIHAVLDPPGLTEAEFRVLSARASGEVAGGAGAAADAVLVASALARLARHSRREAAVLDPTLPVT